MCYIKVIVIGGLYHRHGISNSGASRIPEPKTLYLNPSRFPLVISFRTIGPPRSAVDMLAVCSKFTSSRFSGGLLRISQEYDSCRALVTAVRRHPTFSNPDREAVRAKPSGPLLFNVYIPTSGPSSSVRRFSARRGNPVPCCSVRLSAGCTLRPTVSSA